jgi:hypothetical protein
MQIEVECGSAARSISASDVSRCARYQLTASGLSSNRPFPNASLHPRKHLNMKDSLQLMPPNDSC